MSAGGLLDKGFRVLDRAGVKKIPLTSLVVARRTLLLDAVFVVSLNKFLLVSGVVRHSSAVCRWWEA